MLEAFRQTRLATFQKNISPGEAWVLANANDIQYLTGFVSLVAEEREALLVITQQNIFLLYAAFSPVTKLKGIHYLPGVFTSKISAHLHNIADIENQTLTNVIIDEESLLVSEFRVFEQFAQKNDLTLKASNLDSLQQQRMKKDDHEITLLKQAAQTAKKAWADFEPWLKAGVTEKQACQKLEQLLLKHGSQRPAFPTIVAFGEHSALPHHQPTDMVLQENSAVLVDFGATIENYRSDMTRTIWIGNKVDQKFNKIETIVKKAYDAAIAQTAKPDTRALEIDTAAREVIKAAGFGQQFIHTTGHGVGLDIHEQPSLNWTNTQIIKPGFVITIEPGIYLEGEFGYRYENTVLIENKKAVEITL